MPFHAAGVHANGSRDNAFSRVVSSYTPSIKALGYACSQIRHAQSRHAQSNQTAQEQMLITLMPTTPKGANDEAAFGNLEGVCLEQSQVESKVSPHLSTLISIAPDAEYVLNQLETCQMVHFACHGISYPRDPSSSGLVLQRVATDGTLEQDHLSVFRISQLRLRHAQIAYLPACSTAENKGMQLRDGVIHIVSGFQVAGFPNVVGSLLSAGDEECVEVATHFYSSLFGMAD